MSSSCSRTGAVRLSKLGEREGFFQNLVEQSGSCEKGRGGETLKYFDREKCGSFMVNMGEDLYYPMDRRRVGTAVIINNLDLEQTPTRNDVESMGAVLKDIGKV